MGAATAVVAPLIRPADGQRSWFAPRHAAVALLVALTVLVMLLGSSQVRDLWLAIPALGGTLDWLQGLPLPLDMEHVAFFALVGLALRLLLPGVHGGWLLAGLAALAAATELLQFFAVGRTPKLLDARDDLIGSGIGLLLGWPLLRLAQGVRGAGQDRRLAGSPDGEEPGRLPALLAGWLVGRAEPTPAAAVDRYGVDALLSACEREGVLSLVHARLSLPDAPHPPPVELLQPLALRARHCAARSLLCVSEARKVQQALQAAGIPALWLKGIALGHWLYPRAHLRDIADIDLLLPDHASTLRAADVLAPLGYVLPNPHVAGDLVVHELLAWSERARLELDLHWDLSNDALFADRLDWDALRAQAIPLPALGDGAHGLSAPHALLHACMHRALNHLTRRENRLRWLYDIHLLWTALAPAGQAQAVAMAVRARVAEPMLDALLASQAHFDTPLDAACAATLRDAAAREPLQSHRLRNWAYFQRATLRTLRGTRKLRWLRQLAMPGSEHLRVRYGADGAGRSTLVMRRLRDGWRRWRGYVER